MFRIKDTSISIIYCLKFNAKQVIIYKKKIIRDQKMSVDKIF